MKKLLCFSFLLVFLLSCNKKENITLNVLNDTLVAYSLNSLKDTTNIVKYYIENNSDNSIYVNNEFHTNLKQSLILNDDLLQLNILNNNKIVNYSTTITDFVKPFNCDDSITTINERFEYEYLKKTSKTNPGFILHPKEKKYFIGYVKITDKNIGIKNTNSCSANIEKNKMYYADFFIDAKTSRSIQILSWDVKENIKSNNCIIFDGVIKFPKKIPVKILD